MKDTFEKISRILQKFHTPCQLTDTPDNFQKFFTNKTGFFLLIHHLLINLIFYKRKGFFGDEKLSIFQDQKVLFSNPLKEKLIKSL